MKDESGQEMNRNMQTEETIRPGKKVKKEPQEKEPDATDGHGDQPPPLSAKNIVKLSTMLTKGSSTTAESQEMLDRIAVGDVEANMPAFLVKKLKTAQAEIVAIRASVDLAVDTEKGHFATLKNSWTETSNTIENLMETLKPVLAKAETYVNAEGQ